MALCGGRLRHLILGIIVATLLIVSGIGFFVGRSIAKPIVDLAETTSRIASGRFELRVEEGRWDEIGHLARAFNSMTGQLSKLIGNLEHQIFERKRAEEALKKHRDHLEELVAERTAELTVAKEQAERANAA